MVAGPGGSGTPNGTTQFDVTVCRFAEPFGACLALPYFPEARAEALGPYDIAGPLVGDAARVIGGAGEGGRRRRSMCAWVMP
jgi:hypothetical protein